MHDKHCPPTGTILSFGQAVQNCSELQVAQVEEHGLQVLETASRYCPAEHVETHLPLELMKLSAHEVH
jgi:hypothetical protein